MSNDTVSIAGYQIWKPAIESVFAALRIQPTARDIAAANNRYDEVVELLRTSKVAPVFRNDALALIPKPPRLMGFRDIFGSRPEEFDCNVLVECADVVDHSGYLAVHLPYRGAAWDNCTQDQMCSRITAATTWRVANIAELAYVLLVIRKLRGEVAIPEGTIVRSSSVREMATGKLHRTYHHGITIGNKFRPDATPDSINVNITAILVLS